LRISVITRPSTPREQLGGRIGFDPIGLFSSLQ
jgi:hypothetical protein